MKNDKTTLWAKIDDDRAEHLNGGAGTMKFYIGGGIGAAQPDGDDDARLKILPIDKTHKYYKFYLHKCAITIE
jgi:hypothetical protein